MDQNQFLRDFMKMRHELAAKQATYAAPARRNNAPSMPLTSIPSKPSGISLATIIEDKPSKAELIKYFRRRVDELMEEQSD
jgi:hypothetical protein